jgi:hypothetical protein
LSSEGNQIICRIQVENILSQLAEYPGGVILELEVIFSRRGQLVADAARSMVRLEYIREEKSAYMSNENL